MRLYGFITQDGKLSPVLKDRFLKLIDDLKGKDVCVEISEKKVQRTTSQNAYFHVLVGVFRDELNNLGDTISFEDTKMLIKLKFLFTEKVDRATGEVIKIPGQTSLLTTHEMNDLIEKLKAWAAEMSIYLPDPEEQIEML